MSFIPRSRLVLVAVSFALSACAATTTQLIPSPQLPVCESDASAIVVWAPRWRPNQKDVPDREAAAAEGISKFFNESGCFASVSLRRAPQLSASSIEATVFGAESGYDRLVAIVVRELGPVVKIGSSLALVEGGTEVVLDITEHKLPNSTPRSFSVHWANGGPGVLKGTATLPQDILAALMAGLQPMPR